MNIIVQKYGGTSLADIEKIKRAARRLIAERERGYDVVAVLSAMGKTTDELMEMARAICPSPPAREMDMLLCTGEQVSVALMAMALHAMNYKAISFVAPQVGIYTDGLHTKAKIVDIKTDRIMEALRDFHIVLIAGFQGVNERMEYTTLGRGGSDTSAAALAVKLNAVKCEIFTDVEGVYTADPRVVPNARKLPAISYDEMLELASLGAGVMHSRSIELAKKYDLVIHVRSSFSDTPGTLIKKEDESMEEILVRGAALDKNEAKVTIKKVPDTPGMVAKIFSIIAEHEINVDMIIQNVGTEGYADVSFTVNKSDMEAVNEISEKIIAETGSGSIEVDPDIAKVSVVGIGMRSHCGVAKKMFDALGKAGINIEMISTSEIKISCIIKEEEGERALRLIHEAFELDAAPE